MQAQTTGTLSRYAFLVLAILLCGFATAEAAGGDDSPRVSRSTQQLRADRDRGAAGRTAEYEYAALRTSDAPTKGTRSSAPGKSGAVQSVSPNTDFWFYAADVVLFNDNDADGYYHGIDLLFDADTYYVEADVYAVVYLSLAGGPWNEYAVTDDFSIFGATSDDEFVVVTELLSGYPTGSYDLLIELFDAYTDEFLASYGPVDTPELAFLQLEDTGRDIRHETTTVVVTERGGGSGGPALLLGLLFAGLRRALKSAPV